MKTDKVTLINKIKIERRLPWETSESVFLQEEKTFHTGKNGQLAGGGGNFLAIKS